jgi:putative ABC transport system permease protein
MIKFVPLIFKNVFRKKTRSLLTIGAILLPLFVICIMGTLLQTLDSDPSGGKGMYRLIVRHKVSLTNWIPEAYWGKLRQLPGVKEVSVFDWFGGKYIDGSARNQFARFAVDPKTWIKTDDGESTIVEGSADDWINDRSGALVGRVLMKRFGWKLGQRVQLIGDIYPVHIELTIRGVFKAPEETSLYFNREILGEALPRVKGWVGWYWIKTDGPESASRLTGQIDALFENSPSPTKTESEKDFQNGFISMLGNVKLLVTSIGTIIVLVILLIAANTMAMAARERVTEIAVLRTLGFQKSAILSLILGESLLLSLFGGLLGIAVFTFFFPGFKTGLQNSPMGGFAAGMKLFPQVLLLAFGVTVFVGALAGIVPAIRSAQRSIPDGLRQVG